MKTLRLITLMALMVLPLSFFISCGSDDEGGSTTIGLLTASPWTYTAGSAAVPGDTSGFLAPVVDALLTGTVATISSNNTYTINIPLLPDETTMVPPTIFAGTWILSTDETMLTLTPDDDPTDITIITVRSVTASVLDVTFPGETFDLPLDLEASFAH